MKSPLQIDLRSLPGEGRHLAGDLPTSFFQLADKDPVQVLAPLHYDLHVVRDDDDLNVSGILKAVFSLECGRCLQRFPFKVELENYTAEAPVENDDTIDLTDLIREDIILALPSYPCCEDGNIEPRECPAEGQFTTAADTGAEEQSDGGRGAWDALDQLKQ